MTSFCWCWLLGDAMLTLLAVIGQPACLISRMCPCTGPWTGQRQPREQRGRQARALT